MNIEKKNNTNDTNIESTRGYVYEKPACDIYENNENYRIYFDIPGVEKNDIQLKVEKDILTLKAECTKNVDAGYNCLREEMSYTGYKRSFELNNSVDTDKIAADFNNGTLKLTLPKREEQKTREIKINVN